MFETLQPEQPGQDEWRYVETIGEAAGYIVGLTRADSEAGPMIQVAVGPVAGITNVTMGIYLDDSEHEEDARASVFAGLAAAGDRAGTRGIIGRPISAAVSKNGLNAIC